MIKPFQTLLISLFLIGLGFETYAESCPTGFKRPSYKTRSFYCSPGEFVKDFYDSDRLISCQDMEVDHLIPLKLAHCAGLSDSALKQLANDPDNLRFTSMKTNRSKGAKSLEDFVTTLKPAMREKVLKAGILVKDKFEIPVSRLQRRELIHLGQLRAQKQVIQKQIKVIARRMARRIIIGSSRNIVAAQPQSATGVLAPISLAIIAWELYDACRMMEDLSELEEITQGPLGNFDLELVNLAEDDEAINDQSTVLQIDEKACGMSKSDLFAKVTGQDPEFEACVLSRLNTNLIDPPECVGFEFTIPNFEGDIAKENSELILPSFD
mgnify:CR=1 FL=1|tara:strand:+ start:2845 stop:3816 length:972 start_codon:yes stop_codon:yes gene_type:complete